MRDVTIYPIFLGTEPNISTNLKGCLDPAGIEETEMKDQMSYIESVRLWLQDNELAEGAYILLEFQEDIDGYMGQVFTVDGNQNVIQGMHTDMTPRLTHWPPK